MPEPGQRVGDREHDQVVPVQGAAPRQPARDQRARRAAAPKTIVRTIRSEVSCSIGTVSATDCVWGQDRHRGPSEVGDARNYTSCCPPAGNGRTSRRKPSCPRYSEGRRPAAAGSSMFGGQSRSGLHPSPWSRRIPQGAGSRGTMPPTGPEFSDDTLRKLLRALRVRSRLIRGPGVRSRRSRWWMQTAWRRPAVSCAAAGSPCPACRSRAWSRALAHRMVGRRGRRHARGRAR